MKNYSKHKLEGLPPSLQGYTILYSILNFNSPIMKGLSILAATLALSSYALALPKLWDSTLHKKADSTKVGYLGVYWTTANESVYLALSDNSNPTAFKSINSGKPIVSPTLGTKAVRDVSIIEGVGDAAGKYYIIGTDLDIDTVSLPYILLEKPCPDRPDKLEPSCENWFPWHLRLGEHRPGDMDQREIGDCGGRNRRHGLGS